MTLRRKTLVVIGAMLLGLLAVLYAVAHTILLNSFLDLERARTRQDTEQALSVIADQLSELNNGVGDWAAWDESCAFIQNADPDYVRRNIPHDTFTRLRLNLMLFVDASGHVVFGRAFDLQREQEIPIPEGLRAHLATGGVLTYHPEPESSIKGILLLPEGPLLTASRPILTSERQGPVRGTLIWGRYLDGNEVERLSTVTHLALSLGRLDDPQLPPDFEAARTLLLKEESPVIHPLDSESVAGYAPLEDIYGEPALLLKVHQPRSICKQGWATIRFFFWSLMAGGMVIVLGTMLLLEKMILSRLERLNSGVRSIGASGDLSARVHVSGEDELADLAGAINRMLEALERSRGELQQSEELYRSLADRLQMAHQQLRDIIEFLPDATFVIDREKKVIAWNQATEKMTGVSKKDIIGKGDYAYAVPFYGKPRPLLVDLLNERDPEIERQYELFEIRGNVLYAESFVPSVYNGKGAYVWAMASPLFDQHGNVVGAIESIRDISERKQAEKRLEYLSLHDPLTGLYNRAYFEEEMRRLQGSRQTQVGIIFCDVDDLKLINDSLGHSAGDALLIAAAEVLKESFREGDLTARIGGDEFAVVLPNSGQTVVEDACRRIREAVWRYNLRRPELPLSLSIGLAVGSDASVNMGDLLREADNNMYREKLQRSQGTPDAIVNALIQTLDKKDFIAAGHGDRLEHLVAGMAAAFDLPPNSIRNLRLLARYHDIGNVSIPDQILFKETPLEPWERLELQRHCEVGHRIALSAPELVPIADLILKHHEWWNGEGYPLGLQGEEIPLECRILAVADAYDAMTNDRPYRKALSPAEAVAELERSAGTQFDPQVVRVFIGLLRDGLV